MLLETTFKALSFVLFVILKAELNICGFRRARAVWGVLV